MNRGQFAAQINDIASLLKKHRLIIDHNLHPPYHSFQAAAFRRLSYIDVWTKCYKNSLYDFRLIDDSLLQFRITNFNPLSASYSYLDCPYSPKPNFEDYYADRQRQSTEPLDEIELLTEWEEIPNIEIPAVPIRYDYAPQQYIMGRHPASHVHFGHENDIRVATKKVLLPLSFTLFVLRQCYTPYWVHFLTCPEAELLCRNVNHRLDNVSSMYWGKHDQWEMTLI